LGIGSYGIYTSIITSYYWFPLGKNVASVSAIIYVIVDLGVNWKRFIYTRHIPKMLFDRMVTELTEASTSVSKVDETPLTEPEAEPTEPEDQPTEPDAQPTEPNAQPIDSNKLFIIDW
jgi:hypothetical protein